MSGKCSLRLMMFKIIDYSMRVHTVSDLPFKCQALSLEDGMSL